MTPRHHLSEIVNIGREIAPYQFPNTAPDWLIDNTILITEVGSRAHGTGVDGQDDSDHMGMVIEPVEFVIGLDTFEQYIYRTQPEGVRSGPDDLDLTIYSLRKWFRLALQGNPSILVPLFTGDDMIYHQTYWGDRLRREAPEIVASRQAGHRFLGYLRAQKDRLLGIRGGRHGGKGRPELEQEYGYDTKFAMHMVRLGMCGVEYLSTGRFTEPIPGVKGDILRQIRTGEWRDMADVVELAEGLERRIEDLLLHSPLPDKPDYKRANEFLANAYSFQWMDPLAFEKVEFPHG